MPAKDLYHDAVVTALTGEGWIITDDPLKLTYGGQKMYVDLGAERNTIAAEKAGQKIAVEIKSFLSRSVMEDFENAIGQYRIYRHVLEEKEPDRMLYLAVPAYLYDDFLAERFGQFILKRERLPLIIFDEEQERIITWITP